MHFEKDWNNFGYNFGYNFGPYKILKNLNLYPVSVSSKLQLVIVINCRKKSVLLFQKFTE